MKSLVLALMLVVASLVSGCQTVSDWCLTNEPYRPGSQAELQALSDVNVTQQLEHNRYGQDVCGWKK